MTQRNVAIMLFDEVEVLDFAGPFEVFAVTEGDTPDAPRPFNVYTFSMDGQTVSARNGLSVNPTYSAATMPTPDILLIPGGQGTRPLLQDAAVLEMIQAQATRVERLLSVCTGALLLAQAGVLHGLEATTYHTAFEHLQAIEPKLTVRPDARWVDNGTIVTSAGISAGIDMSLYVVGRLLGDARANATARKMEYDYWPTPAATS